MGCCLGKQGNRKAHAEDTYARRSAHNPTTPAAYVGVFSSHIWATYEPLQELGSGGFGEVRLARHKVLGVERAVKTLRLAPDLWLDDVMDEVNTMKSLDHPSIVRICEVFKDSRHVHLVMELCTGGEFFDAVVERGQFSEADAAKYMLDIFSALAYIHRQGLVHRDIKPENLLLEDQSQNARLKLTDFGASAWKIPQQKLHLQIGSLYYVAPEVFDKEYDEKCDVWSAGVILHILLSGRLPFDGKDDTAIKNSIRQDKLNFKLPQWQCVSKAGKQLIKKMLTKNPALRPSVEELIHDRWIQTHAAAATTPLSDENVRNLCTFSALSKLQQATLSYIASQLLAREDAKELGRTFLKMDLNQDGTLSMNEIKAGIQKLGLDQDVDLEKLLREIDADANGFVEYTEFLVAAVNWNNKLSKEKLWQAFQRYDIDGNGVISLEELRELFSDCSATFLTELIAEADVNGDGQIDFDEFAALMLQKFQLSN